MPSCAPPLPVNTLEPAATGVALTLQALTSSLPPLPSATPALPPTPAPPSLLPHALYFLNPDGAGMLQVFRLDPAGRSPRQITFEPLLVDAYDVSPYDSSVAFTTNNQLHLVDAAGADRTMLLDGGALDENNRWTSSVGSPLWSPDGQTLAYSHGGLSFWTVGTGETRRVLENQIDMSAGFPIVHEVYAPHAYSPDGGKLLIDIGLYEGRTYGILAPSDGSLVRLARSDGGIVCCYVNWFPDGSSVYVTSPSLGMVESGLFRADTSTGDVTTLLPGAAPDGTYNFAWAAQVGADGKLYFLFNNLPEIPSSGHTPLYLVSAAGDGVTDRTQLRAEAFQNVNEILWAGDASLAILINSSSPDLFTGGEAQIVYPDGRPSIDLLPFAQSIRWGP